MKKFVLPALLIVMGLSVLPGCFGKKKKNETPPTQQEEAPSVGKELADLCENKKWCGCDKD